MPMPPDSELPDGPHRDCAGELRRRASQPGAFCQHPGRGGGPGIATDVPSKFVMEYLFERSNIGLAAAGAATMLLTTIAIAAPLLLWQGWQKRRRATRGA